MDTIIVDDEEKAIELLEYHLTEFFDDFNVVGKYQNIADAYHAIVNQPPKVIFLDINMPNGTGIDLLARIQEFSIPTIFITAHSEYALDAIKLSAFDYLLKPISLSELTRVHNKLMNAIKPNSLFKNENQKKIKIQISSKIYVYNEDEIIFASSQGNYTTVHTTTTKPLVITKNLKKIAEEFLNDAPFYRPHQSYIVNMNHVLRCENLEIHMTNNHKAMLSGKNYAEFNNLLNNATDKY